MVDLFPPIVLYGVEHLGGLFASTTFEPQEVTAGGIRKDLQIVLAHQATIRDNDHMTDSKSALKISHRCFNRRLFRRISREYVVSNGKPIRHDDPKQQMYVTWLSILALATVTPQLALWRSVAEVGRRQVVEHQFDLQIKEIAHTLIQRLFNLVLASDQRVQCSVPPVQLLWLHLHPLRLGDLITGKPFRNPSPALLIADESVFQPPGQAMLALWLTQPIGHEHEGQLRYVKSTLR